MSFVIADDGARIFYQDWELDGPPVLFSHGWPLNSDAWEAAALFVAGHGHRAVAHDRRGHGRSSRTWFGNDLDTYADDLDCLIEHLDLRDLTLVGHSAGGGEIVRYIGRYGTARVARVILIGAVPPGDLPVETVDAIRAGELANRGQLYRDLADGPFFGHNRRGDVAQGFRDTFWLQSMACGHRAAYESIGAFATTDFRPDLAKIDVPTLIVHGDDDQIVPVEAGERSAALIDGAVLKVYEGGGHALPDTHRDRLHADILEFVSGGATAGRGSESGRSVR
ncbi:alpha/beta fold hydrolase [Herbidospora daliensis]|uniref:alpha/beta fold hydrolase n=1 Tax=Herbidospora daliensis TaxID=295585 RepID=UPI00078229EA|nr:alpha/beta hydrolase [Herbidospora daliensis]